MCAPPRPDRHRLRLGQLVPRRPVRRTSTWRWSSRGRSAAPASTSAASRRRCSCTPPTSRARSRRAGHLGIDATVDKVRWTDIRDRVFGRIDPISAAGRDYRAAPVPATSPSTRGTPGSPARASCTSTARTVDAHRGPHRARGGQPARRARRSSRSPGVPFHTSDTVMRHRRAARAPGHPRLGLHRRGVRARVLRARLRRVGGRAQRADAARPGRDGPRAVHRAGPRPVGRAPGRRARPRPRRRRRDRARPGRRRRRRAATCCSSPPAGGPNGDRLDLPAAGIPTHPDGRIVVDEFQRTPADGVFALGDVSSPFQLKHVANHESRVVAHNLLHPDALRRTRPPVRAGGGVHRAADRRGRAHRAGVPGRGPRLRGARAGLRRRGVRVGDGGRHRLLQGARRARHRAGCWARTSWGRTPRS